jgi:hypothetical protein
MVCDGDFKPITNTICFWRTGVLQFRAIWRFLLRECQIDPGFGDVLQPPGMIGSEVVDALGDSTRVLAVGVHHPDRRGFADLGAAEHDVVAVG